MRNGPSDNAGPSIRERLRAGCIARQSLLCVGLDPVAQRLPAAFREHPKGFRDFCCAIVDATADAACAFKPQAAHFAAAGAEDQLAAVIAYIHERHPEVLVILDAKRGDIGSTAELYAREAYRRYDADIVTLNPYLGPESLAPFLAYPNRGVALLCRTSNPGNAWLQCHPEDDPVFLRVARAASEWNERGNLMLVAGATYAGDMARIRSVAPSVPLLVPGIGAQGGDLRAVLEAGLDGEGRGLLLSASRSILYAGEGHDFASAARDAAVSLRDSITDTLSDLRRG